MLTTCRGNKRTPEKNKRLNYHKIRTKKQHHFLVLTDQAGACAQRCERQPRRYTIMVTAPWAPKPILSTHTKMYLLVHSLRLTPSAAQGGWGREVYNLCALKSFSHEELQITQKRRFSSISLAASSRERYSQGLGYRDRLASEGPWWPVP
jgi:hypothetical protein